MINSFKKKRKKNEVRKKNEKIKKEVRKQTQKVPPRKSEIRGSVR